MHQRRVASRSAGRAVRAAMGERALHRRPAGRGGGGPPVVVCTPANPHMHGQSLPRRSYQRGRRMVARAPCASCSSPPTASATRCCRPACSTTCIRAHPDARITVACGPVGRGRVRAHAEPRAHHRHGEAALRPALAAALGGQRRHALGPRGRHPRLGALLPGADAAARGHAQADRATRSRNSRPSSACRRRRCRSPGPRPEDRARAAARLLPPGGPIIALGPTANWDGKIWPAERFAALFRGLAAGPPPAPARPSLAGPGPHERALADPLLRALPDAIDLAGRLTCRRRRRAWPGRRCSSATIPA